MSVPEEIAALVFDRTQADVDKVKEYKRRMMTNGISALTEDEMTEYMAGMKGCYNYQDLNRVGAAVAVIAAEMGSYAATLQTYKTNARLPNDAPFDKMLPVTVTAKTDWTMTDIPTRTQMEQYIADIRTLYRNVDLPSTTPVPPNSADHLTWSTANDIEKILWDVWEMIVSTYNHQRTLITRFMNSRIYAGEVQAGETN